MSTTSRQRFTFSPSRRILAAATASLLAAGLVAGCGSSSNGGTSSSGGVTKLTFWAWVPGIGRAVSEFNKTHKNVQVTLDDVGAGAPEYQKLTNAVKAGSGAPDVAEVEFDELPSFEITHSLVDISKYGANNYKSNFVPWAWSEVSQGSAVYAMPGDSGPVALYYNSGLFAKYKITPPTTWARFATAAASLKKADPTAYITNFSATDLQWIMSLMAQANAFPFTYTGGSTVGIDWTGPAQTAFANYWQNLINAKEVNDLTDVAAQAFADMDKGFDATWLSSAWGPSYFLPDAKSSLGQWRAAALPQWTAGANVAANWGGSTYPVFAQSKHAAAAAEFTEWLNGTNQSWNILKTSPSSLFPTYVPLLNDPTFKSITSPLSGKTQPYQVFTAAAPQIKGVEWPPFMTEALTDAAPVFNNVANGKATLAQAFATFQKDMVSYAKAQGFTVTTG